MYIEQIPLIDSFEFIMTSKPRNVLLVEEKTNKKKKVKRLKGQFQRADWKNQNGRIYPFRILKTAIAEMMDRIKARRVLGELDHPCLSTDDFRVLTENGWKEFKDIKIGDKVWSRKNGQMVVSVVNNIINEPYNGDIYHLEGKYINASFTPPHKFILDTRNGGKYVSKQIETTLEDIYQNRKKHNKCKIPRIAQYNSGTSPKYITIPGIPKNELKTSKKRFRHDVTKDLKIRTDVFVSFLGIYLAEGYLGDKHRIEITQFKPHTKKLIGDMLSTFHKDFCWNETKRGFNVSDVRLYRYLKSLGNCYNKYIPYQIKQLDAKYLKKLVYWFQIGDGRMNHGHNHVFTTSKQLIYDLHECWVKSGGCCYFTILNPNKSPLYQLTLSKTKGIHLDNRFLQINKKHHEGNIYCLSVTHGNFYMEHKGHSFWTGNCDAKIHLDRVSHLITDVWMEKDIVYGELEIMDSTPLGQTLLGLIEGGAQVGISSRGVGDVKSKFIDGEEYFEVLPGYQIITWDVVAEPSVHDSYLVLAESQNRLKTIKVKNLAEYQLLELINKKLHSSKII